MHEFWFQQDGATAHSASETITILKAAFPGCLISRFGDFSWPPRSPDLTSPDSFLWCYLKGKVYLNKPNTLQEVEKNIIEGIRLINPAVLESVNENIETKMRNCFNNDGKHFKNIFKKLNFRFSSFICNLFDLPISVTSLIIIV